MNHLRYLDPHCPLTLRQAVDELRQAEGLENDLSASVSSGIAADLDIHDVIHVVFGCQTDLRGEVLAHIWTLFGTDARLSDLHRVTTHRDHRQALRQIGHARLLAMWFRSLAAAASTVLRAHRMKKRLSVQHLEPLLDRRLSEIRAELGVWLPPQSPSAPRDSVGALVRQIGRS